jgi:hypothetical protein
VGNSFHVQCMELSVGNAWAAKSIVFCVTWIHVAREEQNWHLSDDPFSNFSLCKSLAVLSVLAACKPVRSSIVLRGKLAGCNTLCIYFFVLRALKDWFTGLRLPAQSVAHLFLCLTCSQELGRDGAPGCDRPICTTGHVKGCLVALAFPAVTLCCCCVACNYYHRLLCTHAYLHGMLAYFLMTYRFFIITY